MTPAECFACCPPRSSVVGPSGLPRTLCLEHKQQCVVATGERLQELLRRVEGVDYAGPLGSIYNPVFVSVGGERVRGWTDFMAGGMAVYEDCWQVERYVDHFLLVRASQEPALRALLADLVARPPRDAADAYERARRASVERSLELARVLEHVDEVLTSLRAGGAWPADAEEVHRWLALTQPGRSQADFDLAFVDRLRRVAMWAELVTAPV